jgi:hypothetical protein
MKKPNPDRKITRGLIIREPWVGMILDGQKDWEMRTSATKIRGPIALIAAGSGKIIGTADLCDVQGPFSHAQMAFNQARHRIPAEEIGKGEGARWNTAWVMKDAQRLDTPVPYEHPSGAVIWVALDDKTQARLARALAPKRKAAGPKPA